jgi:ABC-type sugar transport system ATPase subunit
MPEHPDQSAGLVIDGVSRRFGDTIALRSLSLTAAPAEILGIAGPNGAGKSTLVKILAGEETADAGKVTLDGSPITRSTRAHGVAVVHQEAQLFPNLTVAQNVIAGRERGWFGRPRCGPRELALLEELGIAGVRDVPLEHCSLATRQRTEIARALAVDARVFLFDEPNSALTEAESTELFEEMHRLAAANRIVMLVSHRLSDLVEHAGRVVVIRDGAVHGELAGDDLTSERIARMLVAGATDSGDDAERSSAERSHSSAPLVRLSSWSDADAAFTNVDMEVPAGTVAAIVGVEGSGGRELLRSLAGLRRATGRLSGPHTGANDLAVAYVPATRDLSLFSNLDVGRNLVVRLNDEIVTRPGVIRRSKLKSVAEDLRRRFLIKAGSLAQGIRSLSGGNQQKVAIAAGLATQPHVLLLEEPTRGVDLSSRREIYRLLRAFAALGPAVIAYCTEVPEVFELADRVYVIGGGRLVAVLDVADYPTVDALAATLASYEDVSAKVSL